MKFSPQPFELDWREADTRRWMAAQGNANELQGAVHPLDQWLARAVGGHVAWRMRQHTFTHPHGAGGLDTHLTRALQELKDNLESSSSQIQVGRYFLEAIKQYVGSEADVSQAHKSLVDFVMTGNIPELWANEVCQATGGQVTYGFHEWRFEPRHERARRAVPTL